MSGIFDDKQKVKPQTLLMQGGSVPEQYDTSEHTPQPTETLDMNEYRLSDYPPVITNRMKGKRRYAR